MKKEQLKALVDKIQSMSAKEIVLTMVHSLRNPVTKIDMSTFGMKDDFGYFGAEGICYGCAATNTICRIGNFNPSEVLDSSENRSYIELDWKDDVETTEYKMIIDSFEGGIDKLRQGYISSFNKHAIIGGFAKIDQEKYKQKLPLITDCYTEVELKEYENFANTL